MPSSSASSDLNLRKPYRIAVWGPGSAGLAAIREAILLPEIELVAVKVYSDAKAGMDVGVLAGMPAIGVKATQSAADFVATGPECVIYMARDYGDHLADDDIVMLLEAGINVITALPYHFVKLRGEVVAQRLEAAAKKGGATLFATGVNPGFMFDRLAIAATGLVNGVEHISLGEYVNCEHMPGAGEFLTLMGFGMEQADKAATDRIGGLVASYLTQYLYYVADKIGCSIERIERTDEHVNAPHELDIPGLMKIKAGSVARVGFHWTAYSQGKPLLSTEVKWYVTEVMRPEVAKGKGDDCWIIEIHGRPTAKITVELFGAAMGDNAVNPQNPAGCAWLSTAIPAIQAIPQVIAAKPGVMMPEAPQMHYKRDLRIGAPA